MKLFATMIVFLISLILFASNSPTAARLLLHQEHAGGSGDGNGNADAEAIPSLKINDNDISNLMGMEGCSDEKKDEECLKRRMTAEAHLDYIYTQSHNP